MKYNRKLRIVQVTPGLIQIPPNGWGAVEKMIWEYKLAYESLGYICDIKYLSDIKPGDYDMVHIHVANLALEAYENNIPYYFTMHDHHTIYFGKDSFAYKQNKEAIQKSIKSFVPAKYLLDFFDCKNLYYVPHGVNPDVFTYGNYTSEHKLLCVGNNGMINNPSIDRKGFIYAIEAARALNMDITIAGPENNKKFFKLNMDFKPYNKLNLVYNPTEEELINIYHSHTIFLHPSNLEAGQPNLTLMEALSCGLPIISTYEDEGLPGMRKIVRDTELIVNEIKDVINNYDYLKKIGVEYARNNTWVTSVSKILDLMNTKQTMEDQLITNYENTKIKHQPFKSKKNKILIDFVDGPKVEILGSISGTYNVKFIDNDSGKILYEDIIKNNFWTKCSVKHFMASIISPWTSANAVCSSSASFRSIAPRCARLSL